MNQWVAEKYPKYITLDDFQGQSRAVPVQQPDPMMVLTAHSSSKPHERKRAHQPKKVKELKFEDKDDLLIENFETGFDDDLEAILGGDFIGMVTTLPPKFGDAIESKSQDDDCFVVFPG